MARKLSNQAHTMTRTSDGRVFSVWAPTERAARRAVFYSAVDNSGAPKREANTFADSFDVGTPATFGAFTYLIERTP
mgnify:CR=1 FL=1